MNISIVMSEKEFDIFKQAKQREEAIQKFWTFDSRKLKEITTELEGSALSGDIQWWAATYNLHNLIQEIEAITHPWHEEDKDNE
jgi:hypothetical protein